MKRFMKSLDLMPRIFLLPTRAMMVRFSGDSKVPPAAKAWRDKLARDWLVQKRDFPPEGKRVECLREKSEEMRRPAEEMSLKSQGREGCVLASQTRRSSRYAWAKGLRPSLVRSTQRIVGRGMVVASDLF